MKRLLLILLPLLLTFSIQAQKLSRKEQTAFDQAIGQYQSHHYNEAKITLRKIASKHPQLADPYFYLGMMAADEERNATAIRRYFTKLEEIAPDYSNALAHYYFAIIDYTDEKYEQAIQHLNRYFEMVSQSQDKELMQVYNEASNYLYWSQFLAEAMLNQVPFNPQVVRGVSSRTNEMLPYLTWDGKEFYYLRNVVKKDNNAFYTSTHEKSVPMLCMSKLKEGKFTSGEALPYPFNQGGSEGNVTLTADGNIIHYTAQGPNSFDIYRSVKEEGVWQKAEPLGKQVNSDRYWDAQPSITPDGECLYFASNREGGYGGTDIWRCHRLPNGDWSRAENLGPSVNTSGNEKSPFIHADGKTLYFSSNGWQGFGGYDMYFINLQSGDQRPTNMGMPINGDGDDICFGITADGNQGYFADKMKENNGEGGYDIFMFELYPDARPEGMQMKILDQEYDEVVVRRYGAPRATYLNTRSIMVSLKEKCVIALYKDDKITIDTKLTNSKGELTPEGRMALELYAEYVLGHPYSNVLVQGPQAIADYLIKQKINPQRITLTRTDAPARITIQ